MNLEKIDEAIENLCNQLSDLTKRGLPACTYIDDICSIGTASAEIGSSLATLLATRKMYETET